MAVLPAALQPLLTWLTGKPLPGQVPLWRMTPWSHVVTGLLTLLLGAASSAAIVLGHRPAAWPLLVVSWILTVGGARKLQVMVCHQIIHTRLTGIAWVDRLFVEVITTLLWVQGYDSYRRDHIGAHHGVDFGKAIDPDFKFLLSLGIAPGVPRDVLWRRLLWLLVSPRFHGQFLLSRARSNFTAGPPYRIAMSCVYLLALAGPTIVLPGHAALPVLAMAWVFPVLILYQQSALLQFVCEHRWEQSRVEAEGLQKLAGFTLGRFCGEPAPSPSLPAARRWREWGWWAMRITLIHLPSRLFVLVGDMPQHDWHHRNVAARGDEWSNPAYARAKDVETLPPDKPPYQEVWGLWKAIDGVFDRLSRLSPPPGDPTSQRSSLDS